MHSCCHFLCILIYRKLCRFNFRSQQHYLIQIIVFQLIFLLVYELFLKKETFFTYNRTYLLVTPVIALLLPLLKIPVLQTAIPAETFVMLPEVFIGGSGEVQTGMTSNYVTSEAAQTINWWLLAYGAGFIIGAVGGFQHQVQQNISALKIGGILRYHFVNYESININLMTAYNIALSENIDNEMANLRLGLQFPIARTDNFNLNVFGDYNYYIYNEPMSYLH